MDPLIDSTLRLEKMDAEKTEKLFGPVGGDSELQLSLALDLSTLKWETPAADRFLKTHRLEFEDEVLVDNSENSNTQSAKCMLTFDFFGCSYSEKHIGQDMVDVGSAGQHCFQLRNQKPKG